MAALADESFDRFDPTTFAARLLAGGDRGALAPAPDHAVASPAPRQAHRPAGHDERVARDRLGIGDPGANAAPPHGPRRVVLVCDVSRSMQPYATIYLHLMRA